MGSTGLFSIRTSKCVCGPVELPGEPTRPTSCPRWTTSPSLTTIVSDQLGRLLEILLGEHRLLDLAEDTVGLHLDERSPARRHLGRVGLHDIERRQRLVDGALKLRLE